MRLRTIAILCGLLSFLSSAHSAIGPFTWLDWFESTNSSVGGIGSDQAGHIYVAGNYTGNLSIDGRRFPYAENADIFIAELTRHGKVISVQRLDSGGDDSVTHLAVGKDGTLFLCGTWGLNQQIDGTIVQQDLFVCAVRNRRLRWSERYALLIENSGISSVTISLKDQTVWALGNRFGQFYLKQYAPDGTPITDMFVSDGCCGYPADIAVGTNGNPAITGTRFGFQPFIVGGTNITPFTGGLQFTASLNSVGRLLWVWGAPSGWVTGEAGIGQSIDIGENGSVISAGRVLHATFGIPYSYAFASKHTAEGMLEWMQIRGEHRGWYYASDVAVDASGNVYVVGQAHGYYWNPNSRTGAMMLAYDLNGNQWFEKRINSVSPYDANTIVAVCVNRSGGEPVVAGWLSGQPIFGTNALPWRPASWFIAGVQVR